MRYLWIAAALGLSLVGGLAVHPANASQQAGETQLGDEAELDALPELVRFVEADYPPEALRRGIEGTVLLDLVINETGRVDSVAVAQGIDPSLDIAAVRAARDFVFTPAMAAGEPVAVLLQYEYAFSIREETRRISEYVNFSGTLREVVAVSFPDPGADTTLTVPWDAYLERLGEFGGQFLEGESVVTYTDSLGQFAFKSLPSGPLLVAFPNAGYPFTQQVEELGRGAHLQIDYWLERTSYDEYELVVYGKAEDKEVTRQRLELTEVQKIPGLGGDALRVVQTMPGVARPTFMWGDVIVRGSSADDTRFYLDGVDIPLLFHFGGLKSTYNSLALSSIDLEPGGFNTRYGGCVGGVIEIKGRPGPPDGWHGILDLNLLDASAVLGGPIGKRTTLTLTGRHSYISNVFALAEDVFNDVDLSIEPYYWDLVGRADIDLHENHNLLLTAFSVGDEMRFIFEGEDEGSTEINETTDELYMKYHFDRFILGLDSRLGRNWDNELRLSIGKDNYVGRFLGYARYDFKLNTYTLRNQLSYHQRNNLTYNLGLDLLAAPLDYEVLVLGSGESFENKTFADFGTYTGPRLARCSSRGSATTTIAS
jgi:TonB family protein